MTVTSPRDNAGFKMSAIPFEPLPSPIPPAPKIWWISSKNKITLPRSLTSLIKFWMFSSKLPRNCVPASRPEISMLIISLFLIAAGTSPLTIAWAKPSTTAVFPTPASPTKTGLFFVRRDKISAVSWISLFLPITGSSLPSRASCVKFRPNFSRMPSFLPLPAILPCWALTPFGNLPVFRYSANSSGVTSRPLIK